ADLGGWPGAIRAALRGRFTEGLDQDALVMGYVAAVLRDLRFDDIRSFLLRSAVPDSFDVDLLRVIAPSESQPDSDGPPLLAHLRSSGLLRAERTEDGVRYRYAPAIRRALRQVI